MNRYNSQITRIIVTWNVLDYLLKSGFSIFQQLFFKDHWNMIWSYFNPKTPWSHQKIPYFITYTFFWKLSKNNCANCAPALFKTGIYNQHNSRKNIIFEKKKYGGNKNVPYSTQYFIHNLGQRVCIHITTFTHPDQS